MHVLSNAPRVLHFSVMWLTKVPMFKLMTILRFLSCLLAEMCKVHCAMARELEFDQWDPRYSTKTHVLQQGARAVAVHFARFLEQATWKTLYYCNMADKLVMTIFRIVSIVHSPASHCIHYIIIIATCSPSIHCVLYIILHHHYCHLFTLQSLCPTSHVVTIHGHGNKLTPQQVNLMMWPFLPPLFHCESQK